MKHTFKIPTSLGIFLFAVIVLGFVFTFEQLSRKFAGASGSIQPSNVKVTNLSDAVFTVTWITEKPTTGALIVSSDENKKRTFFDDRTTAKKLHKYTTHSVTATNLKPNTQYSVVLLSDGKQFLNENQPFFITTGPTITQPISNITPAYGTILTPENIPAEGAIVYITLEGSQTLSTLVKSSGSWLVTLNTIRTQDGTKHLPNTENLPAHIDVMYENKKTSAMSVSNNISPLPSIIIGKTYDFRSQQLTPNQQIERDQQNSSVLGTQQAPASRKVSLIYPSQNAAISTRTPLIKGTGIPGNTITITIGIASPYSDMVTIGEDGIWRYTPKKSLLPGKQSVTITTKDASNTPIAITHMFEVLKSGTQVLGEATGSATLTPSPTLDITPTEISTQSATVSAAPTATLIPTNTPYLSPTPQLIGQAPPTSGSTTNAIILIILGASLLLFGLVLSNIVVSI